MGLYVKKIVTDKTLSGDVRTLIPDAGLRRRMSRIVKLAVAVASECAGGSLADVEAVITATGYGPLADSERFLRNVITDREQLLNPVPFIYSTFNSVGGLLALLGKNRCYNMTYVGRTHAFEDALLDAWMRAEDGEADLQLVGSFDERTDTQYAIMQRMGLWRKGECGEGAMFALLSSRPCEGCLARVSRVMFPEGHLTAEDCLNNCASREDCQLIYSDFTSIGLYPTASAGLFARGLEMLAGGVSQVVIYNELWGGDPAVVVLECLG